MYKKDMKELHPRTNILPPSKFGEAFHKLVPQVINGTVVMNERNHSESALKTERQPSGYRLWLHVIPSLPRTREAFEVTAKGNKTEWDEPTEWEQLEHSYDAFLPEQR
jgi:hypothetical protein